MIPGVIRRKKWREKKKKKGEEEEKPSKSVFRALVRE